MISLCTFMSQLRLMGSEPSRRRPYDAREAGVTAPVSLNVQQRTSVTTSALDPKLLESLGVGLSSLRQILILLVCP
jgi:hypothetical protein